MGGEDSFQLLSLRLHEVFWSVMRPRIALASRDASKATRERVARLKLSRNPAVRSFEFD